MQQFIQTLEAGETWRLQTGGDYFRLVSCPFAVDIKFYKNSMEAASATQMDTGFYLKPANGFDRVDITSAAAQTIKIMILTGDGGYDRFNVDLSSSAILTLAPGTTVDVTSLPAITGVVTGTVTARDEILPTITDGANVSVGTAATVIADFSASPTVSRKLAITNDWANTDNLYIGGSGVTVANGAIRLAPGQTMIEENAGGAKWYAISGTAAQTARIQARG